jgi:KUP system potassium uptake protein
MAVDTGVAPTRSPAQLALLVGALGVVFGDIGTSPIYTVQTVFNPDDPHPVPANADSVYGVISLIFWSVTIIVTIKYVLLVMRADNDGEGGILALITLIRRRGVRGGRRTKLALAALGIFGASLFFGDSMITPARSWPSRCCSWPRTPPRSCTGRGFRCSSRSPCSPC